MIKITFLRERPLEIMGQQAGFCYNTTNPKAFKRIAEQCLSENHGRVLEWPHIEFEFSEFSGKVVREIFRHKHMSELQESTRYVDMENFEYQTPPSISNKKEALEVWDQAMVDIRKRVTELKELGVPTEDFSNIIPLAYDTKGVIKVGLRELIHMFGVRSCTCAYHEARKFMLELKRAIMESGDEQWIFLANEYLVPKCERLLYCEEEKRWSQCKRKPKKSQVKEWIKEKMNEADWRK